MIARMMVSVMMNDDYDDDTHPSRASPFEEKGSADILGMFCLQLTAADAHAGATQLFYGWRP